MRTPSDAVVNEDASPDPRASVRERVRHSFDRQGLMRRLGAELIDVVPGRVSICLDARPELSRQHGHVHGGAGSAIADTAEG